MFGTEITTDGGVTWTLASINTELADAQAQIPIYEDDASPLTAANLRVVQQQTDGTWAPYTP